MKERGRRKEMCLQDTGGFTLVELILTIAILAVVTIPILSYFTDAAKHNARSRMKQNASVLAQDILEDFKNTPYSLDNPTVVCSAQPEWTVSVTPDADGTYTLSQTATVDKNSYQVTAQVKPVNKVDKTSATSSPAASPAASSSMAYEKYLIGTMDSSKDVMASEHGQTLTAAGLAFASKYNAACTQNGTEPDTVNYSAEKFQDQLNCAIIISAKKDTSKTDHDIITVKYRYTYRGTSYPAGIDSSFKYEDIVESGSLDVTKLENIYLFYKPLNENDTIQLETDDDGLLQSKAGDLNLFVIAQSSVSADTSDADVPTGYTKRPAGYKLALVSGGSGFQNKITKLYLNLETTELDATDTVAQKAQKDPSGKFTLVHTETANRLADITVTVKDLSGISGSTSEVVQVSGSKVQN